MAYIGVQPADAYTSFAVQHFTTSATTSYTLDNPVANENEIALFINNVRQQPGSSYAYTASGTTLTLSAATTTSDTMYCVFIGKAVQTVTPTLPIANFSSTGIDDNANATAITIDSSERVGVNTSSPVTPLSVGAIQETGTDRASLSVKTISNSLTIGESAIQIEEQSGTEAYFIGVDSTGGLFFSNSGSASALVIDDSDNLKFNSGYGSATTAYGVRAWVNFNGTGTVAIRDNGNVSSITDNGTGDYTVNFSTAMPDANYSVLIQSGEDTSGSHSNHIGANLHRSAPTTSACRVNTSSLNGSAVDHEFVFVGIIR